MAQYPFDPSEAVTVYLYMITALFARTIEAFEKVTWSLTLPDGTESATGTSEAVTFSIGPVWLTVSLPSK